MLENDFGTKDEETIIKEILKTGNVVKVSVSYGLSKLQPQC